MVIACCVHFVDSSHSTRLPSSSVQMSLHGFPALSMTMFVTLQAGTPKSNVTGKTGLSDSFTALGSTLSFVVL